MGDDKILQLINYIKNFQKQQDSEALVQKREQAGDMFKSSNPKASDSEMVDYATNPENHMKDIDPTGMMGSTRAVREFGPALGKYANEIASDAKTFNNSIGKHLSGELDFHKYSKNEGMGKMFPGELDALKKEQKYLGKQYEPMVNDRNKPMSSEEFAESAINRYGGAEKLKEADAIYRIEPSFRGKPIDDVYTPNLTDPEYFNSIKAREDDSFSNLKKFLKGNK